MIDVNWDDNAKAAAMKFAEYMGQKTYCERFFEYILPKVSTQTKTVADAVEAFNGEWNTHDFQFCSYSTKHDEFFTHGSNYKNNDGEYLVCTREQFEAYVKEQEGEKWTHVADGVTKCIVLSTHGEASWVLEEGDVYETYFSSCIKPIKPTITKAEAWDMIESVNGSPDYIKEKYDII